MAKLNKLLGKLSSKLGSTKPADYLANNINKLVSLVKDAGQAAGQKNWQKSADIWQKIAQDFGQATPAEVLVGASASLRRLGKFDQANKLVQLGIANNPKYLGLKMEFAEIATTQKNWPLAIKRWQTLLQSHKSKRYLAAAYTRLIYCYVENGNYRKAQAVTKEALNEHPMHLPTRLSHCQLAMHQGQWSEAATRWQKVMTDFSHNLPADAWASYGLSLSNSLEPREATMVISAGISRYPNNLLLRMTNAEIIANQKNWPEALNRWQAFLDEFGSLQNVDSKLISQARLNVSVIKRLVDLATYRQQISDYIVNKKKRRAKIVLYTAITKGYDCLKLPEFISADFDYVVYTNNKTIDGFGVYETRAFPNTKHDDARTIRYVKTHPHKLFKNYDVAIWIDANISVIGDIRHLVTAFQQSSKPIAAIKHPYRRSIYEEFLNNKTSKKDDAKLMQQQIDRYKKEGFAHFDLAEAGLLMFDPHNHQLATALELWWLEVRKYSKRDQLSFNYALYKNSIAWHRIMESPYSIRNHPDFVLTAHGEATKTLKELYGSL